MNSILGCLAVIVIIVALEKFGDWFESHRTLFKNLIWLSISFSLPFTGMPEWFGTLVIILMAIGVEISERQADRVKRIEEALRENPSPSKVSRDGGNET